MDMLEILQQMLKTQKMVCQAKELEVKRLYECIDDIKVSVSEVEICVSALEEAIKKLGGGNGSAKAKV